MKYSVISKKSVYDAGIFEVFKTQCTILDNNKPFNLHTLSVNDWVHIIPILKKENGNDEIVLVKQLRHGIQGYTLEFPAGQIEKNENPNTAAMRELKEETGFTSVQCQHLISYFANPAIMNNTVHAYVAELDPQQDALSLDETEDIEVVIMPLRDLLENPVMHGFNNGSQLTSLFLYKCNLMKSE